MSRITSPATVIAAGAVCWREVDGKLKVLVVNRKERADTGLPKGKLDPGETPPQAAVREILEETGLVVHLGIPLGSIDYTITDGREKTVYYWAAEVSEEAISKSTFKPNAEIASLNWLSLAKARKALSYDRDKEILDEFETYYLEGKARTFAIIALRHGKAIPPSAWDGPDSSRPLMHRGLDQAEGIAPAIAAFGPVKVISSSAARCLATVKPLIRMTGVPLKSTKAISQDAFEEDEAKVRPLIHRLVGKHETVVLCSHGPVLPEIVGAVVKETATKQDDNLRRAAMLSTAEFTVLHICATKLKTGIVKIETHTPLPEV